MIGEGAVAAVAARERAKARDEAGVDVACDLAD